MGQTRSVMDLDVGEVSILECKVCRLGGSESVVMVDLDQQMFTRCPLCGRIHVGGIGYPPPILP